MRAKTIMYAGHRISSQRGSEPARLAMLARRFATLLVALCLLAVAPQSTRADFVADPGTTDQGTSPCASLSGEGSSFLALFCERIGAGAAEKPSPSQDDQRPPENDRQPGRPCLVGDAANGGCGSSSSAPSGGATTANAGMLGEIPPAAGITCSGRVGADGSLRIPAPLASRLLDPPR
jgi:hypothetical protein